VKLLEKFIGVARRWYQKAVHSDDSFDQFISIWISFNAIYGRRDGNEFRKIKSIINEFDNETITKILSFNEVQFFCNLVPAIQYLNINQEIENTIEDQSNLKRNINRDPRKALENLMFILNKVRNNLFHGDKRIERSRDVEIVKNAYPIVKEIVKSHLRLDDDLVPVARETASSSDSIEKHLFEKIEDLKTEINNFTYSFSTIPKDKNHPISILLDRINMQANAIEPGFTTSEQLKEIQKSLLEKYEKNKPEILKDIEEVYNFVAKRITEVIENGCSEKEVSKFYDEYMELQKKYYDKGYQFNM
jgi:hypothetical protein